MTQEELKLLDFRVIDLKCHVHPGVSQDLELSAGSRVSASTPEPFDGTLYLYLTVRVCGPTEELFLLELTSETIVQLPEGVTAVTEEDAPACIAVAKGETTRAIRELTTAMGITPLDLAAAEA